MSDKQLKIICYFLFRIYKTFNNSCYNDEFKEMYKKAELNAETCGKL